MLSDFKFSLRALAKTPGFTAIAVITLALAIGVNSAVFALVNGLILRPLVPLRPAEIVNVFTARKGASKDYRQFSHAEYLALREAKDVFADVAAIQFGLAGIGRDGEIRRSFAFFTSENFFSLCGVAPALGRFYSAEECRPNANLPVVVTSYSYWQRAGGKADFLNSALRVNGKSYTVIGVAPWDFSGLNALASPDIWLPLGVYAQFAAPFGAAAAITDLAHPKNYTLNVTARLAPGLTLASLAPRLPVVAQRLTALQPADATGERELQVEPPSRFNMSTNPSGDSPLALLALAPLAMAGAVLLIACLNLANMLLARGTARTKEIALRLALGASRWRVVRQLLAEGVLLALAGGVLGLLVAFWSNDLLLGSLGTLFTSMNFSLAIDTHPDAVVLAVTFLFCLTATLMFSLGPALRASRVDLVHDLKQQAGDTAGASRLNRFFAPRHCLVMAQIALSLMLLFSAGLFFRGALKAGGLDLGFEPAGGLVAELDFSLGNTPEVEAKRAMFAAVDRVRAMPGVQSAALATFLPYGNVSNQTRVIPASAAPSAKATDKNAPDPGVDGDYSSITPGYFDALGVRLLRGRDFTATEASDRASPRVAIIDEILAKKLFPDGNALGQRIRYTQPPAAGSPAEMEIVGIVAQHRHNISNKHRVGFIFVPLAQAFSANVFIHARLATKDRRTTAAGVAQLRSTLRALDPDLPVLQILPFTTVVEKNISLWVVRIGAVLFGVFGGVALALAVVGVYGVKAYAVARRTREIGIHMALGAQAGDVLALILRQGALQTALAVVVGVGLSLAAGQLLATMLYQVSPADPFALGTAAALLTAAALFACWIPARRATRINPITALRTE